MAASLPVYAINLDRDVDRMASIWRQVPDAIRIKAVDGKLLTDEQVRLSTTAACYRLCSRSMVGCYMSHVRAWRLVSGQSGWLGHLALILEVDVVLAPDFRERVAAAIRLWPEADIIHVGCTDMCMALNALHPRLFSYTSAYVISRPAAAKLLAERGAANYHADFSMALAGLEVRVLYPPVAYQDTVRFQSGQFVGSGTSDRVLNTVVFQVGGSAGWIITFKTILLVSVVALAARPDGSGARTVACCLAGVLAVVVCMSAFGRGPGPTPDPAAGLGS